MYGNEFHRESPRQIAEYSFNKDGEGGAYETALNGALEAQSENNNFRLSVWREVKQLLAT